MSYPIVIPWLPTAGNQAAIAPLQNVVALGGNLQLVSGNASLPQGPYIYDRVLRQVSLTSLNNLSGANFTITGIGSPQDGVGNPTQVLGPISEVLVGPNADSVESVNIYSQVTSISVNMAVNGISAGFGNIGITDYVFLDYNRSRFQTSVQLQILNRTTLFADVNQTLNKPEYPNINFGNLSKFAPLPIFPVTATFIVGAATAAGSVMEDCTVTTLGILQSPVALTWATVRGTPNTPDNLFFTVLQQGIR